MFTPKGKRFNQRFRQKFPASWAQCQTPWGMRFLKASCINVKSTPPHYSNPPKSTLSTTVYFPPSSITFFASQGNTPVSHILTIFSVYLQTYNSCGGALFSHKGHSHTFFESLFFSFCLKVRCRKNSRSKHVLWVHRMPLAGVRSLTNVSSLITQTTKGLLLAESSPWVSSKASDLSFECQPVRKSELRQVHCWAKRKGRLEQTMWRNTLEHQWITATYCLIQ